MVLPVGVAWVIRTGVVWYVEVSTSCAPAVGC